MVSRHERRELRVCGRSDWLEGTRGGNCTYVGDLIGYQAREAGTLCMWDSDWLAGTIGGNLLYVRTVISW